MAVAAVQHGKGVHGKVLVPSGGSRLVDPAAGRRRSDLNAGLRDAGGQPHPHHLHAGRVAFAVAINSRAQRALRRHGRLKLLVRLTLSAPGAGSAHRSLTVQLRAG